MPVKAPAPNFREGHPNLELEVFERVAASPHTFIQPRIRVWREYRHEMEKAFEHVWNWPVPEEELVAAGTTTRSARPGADGTAHRCPLDNVRTPGGGNGRGPAGGDRRRKVEELCRVEIEKTLRDVSERMQRQFDLGREREETRSAGSSRAASGTVPQPTVPRGGEESEEPDGEPSTRGQSPAPVPGAPQ
jgi:hypothetical protein